MKGKRENRRRQYFSNPRVQTRIIFVFAVLAMLYAGTNYYIAKSMLWSVTSEVLRLPLSEANRGDVNLVIEQQDVTLDLQLGAFTLLVVVVLVLGGILLSHRVGGPIYQLKTYLNQLTEGSVQPRRIRFRKHDFFHDLADRFNEFQTSRGILDEDGSGEREQ